MRRSLAITASAVVGLAVSAPGVMATPLSHAYRHHVYRRPLAACHDAPPYVRRNDAYVDSDIVEQATIRAQHEPGVTSELAPDAKQTATGGPVGGVPGFSGF